MLEETQDERLFGCQAANLVVRRQSGAFFIETLA
jgi:hypothetical protein